VPLTLRVEFTQRGTSRFPELYLEAPVDVNTDADVTLADLLLSLSREVSAFKIDPNAFNETALKARLVDVLDLTNEGWRTDEVVINWVKEQGVEKASEMLLTRHLR
jgi:DNA repair exonuclease SbcCD nuclease subunit